jgi:hypothetical protein
MTPVQEKSTPKDAQASTPAKPGNSRQKREEAQERFEAASRALYVLVDTGQPDRLERIGELMDRLAQRLS